jgi:3-phenylpropionate/cinnamic acid dioxygenase small subunit
MPQDHAADRIALQDLMLNYAAGIDERDFERYKGCFAQDVEVSNFGTETYRGLDAWLEYVWEALEKYSSTQHLLGPQLATVEGDRANTRSDVQALHFTKEDTPKKFILWATYNTDMARIDGQWKIVRHDLTVRGTHAD